MLILLRFPACRSAPTKAAPGRKQSRFGNVVGVYVPLCRRRGTRSRKGLLTVAERQRTWINIWTCRAAYLVENYWLLQACHCDHRET